jgi:putative ATP-dependent endonuclease of OLD family
LREGLEALSDESLDEHARTAILNPLRDIVLNTAKRLGKARFAQIAVRHVDQATVISKYLADAARWLVEP